MQILGELEQLPEVIVQIGKRMGTTRPEGELVVLVFGPEEIKTIMFSFNNLRNNRGWVYTDQSQLEQAELMYLIEIALKNANRHGVKWFSSMSEKIFSDPAEFNEKSLKTLIVTGGLTFIVINYFGKWITGEVKQNDRIIRDIPDESMDDVG